MYTVPTICLIVILLFNCREVREANSLKTRVDRYYIYLSQLFIFIGVLLRFVYLEYPYGINLDEAIAGYDAWCLAHYGVDQHLNSYPVYLKSWGSGQSALYAYLSAPFIYIFGLSLPVHRLPMAIVSSAGIVAMYCMVKKAGFSKFFVFLVTLFIVFNPWHFTKSRWALDCNLAPDLALIGTCFVIMGYYAKELTKQTVLYTLAFIFFGITAYAYGVAWMMLPFYCLFILIYLFRKRKISAKACIISIISAFVVALPILLFAYQLITNGEQYQIGAITIPSLNEGRQESTNILSLNSSELTNYIVNTAKSLATGYDYLLTNSFPYTGQFYNPLGWAFILLSCGWLLYKKALKTVDYLFLFWLIACIPITLFVEYNVNRWNMLWIPLIYFCIRGVDLCIANRKIPQILFYILFTALTAFTAVNYCLVHDKAFLHGIDDAIAITSSPKIEKVYFSHTLQYPPIVFYDPISPYVFNETKNEINPNSSFIFLSKLGKYSFEPAKIEPKTKAAYVIRNEDMDQKSLDLNQFNIKKNNTYTILWNE